MGLRERLIRGRAMQVIDGAGGGALIAAVALGVAWVCGAVALHTPGAAQMRADVQESLILRGLNQLLPPSGPLLNALSRVDPAPSIAAPTTPLSPPDSAIASDPDVMRAGESVVRVLGTACGLGIAGSGWVAAPEFVVTNAHVIAGEDDTTVTTQDGASIDAVPVGFDPDNDLALLQVEAPLPPLRIDAEPDRGTGGAVLGYPENGPFSVTPARLGETQTVISEDSYGGGPIRRDIAFLRGSVRSGNSGGPVVDSQGRVMGTVFAATTSGAAGGYAIPNGVVEEALGRASGPVDTGPCTG
jgi:S1-C subfamily serine protease